jgi:hypothetical protein
MARVKGWFSRKKGRRVQHIPISEHGRGSEESISYEAPKGATGWGKAGVATFPSECLSCGEPILRGDRIYFRRGEGAVHANCKPPTRPEDEKHNAIMFPSQEAVEHETQPIVHTEISPGTEVNVGDKIYMYDHRGGNPTISGVESLGEGRLISTEGVSHTSIQKLKDILNRASKEDRGKMQFILLPGGMRGGMSGRGTARGRYTSSKDTMYISARSGLIDKVILHEIGHRRYFRVLSSDERQAWEFHWQNYIDQMPSEYAKHSPEEAYAECYATSIQGDLKSPELLKFFSTRLRK